MSKEEYLKKRQELLDREKQRSIGSDIVLSEKEQIVNDKLMKFKKEEIEKSFAKDAPFAPAVHFFHGKSLIEKSEVFKIIKQIPKGAALHLHAMSFVDLNWFVKHVMYKDNAYMRTDDNGIIEFHFYKTPPDCPENPWKSINAERTASGDANAFDKMIYDYLSLVVENPEKEYPSNYAAWKKFGRYFRTVANAIRCKEVFYDYFYEGLCEFYEDNVQYIELRSTLPEIYDLDGIKYDKNTAMQLFREGFVNFVKEHPDFSGGKIIFNGLRFAGKERIKSDIETSLEFLKTFPDIFAGYDMSGHEDKGKPLIDYIDELLYPQKLDPPVKLPYFFHVAETGWQGTFSDADLFDSILLDATRIGHGFQLAKHPEIMKIAKEKKIAIEVQPISNQVLKLVDDLRNHPGTVLIANGLPVVICSDDVGVWNARGISYDYYMAFMGMTGKEDDLRVLKQLIINSLEYSAMNPEEKAKAFELWRTKWDKFIEDMMQ